MFTGLVQSLAQVVALLPEASGARLVIDDAAIASLSTIGASIAVNGCCLTVVEVEDSHLTFQAGEETLSRTNLGQLTSDDWVNLESSLRMGDELGGHFVTGHIDAVGLVDAREEDGEWAKYWFKVPRSLTKQMASKGSITIDGVSLTLVEVEDERFSVALIPHTLANTTLGRRSVGEHVNVETDILAKYVERQINWRE